MKSLADHIHEYAAYHQNGWNKLTHFVGVPLVTFAILHFFSWLRFYHAPETSYFTGGTLFYFAVCLYFLRLDWQITLLQAPFTLTLLWLADRVAMWPSFGQSLAVFAATFVGGWIIQLAGHAVEGRRPALADNILQLFNAPIFLTAEVVVQLGYRDDLRRAMTPAHGAPASTPHGAPDQALVS